MEEYEEAALRHYHSANSLKKTGDLDNAGHLIGFSAECAIKHLIRSLRKDGESPHGHFPDFLFIARKHVTQRSSMADLLKNKNLLAGWDVKRRYWATGNTSSAELDNWIADTKRILACAGIRTITK